MGHFNKEDFEETIKYQIDLVNRANNRIIAWQSFNDVDMVEQWERIKAGFQIELDELQKEYDLIFGKKYEPKNLTNAFKP
jgi:hypothetical protein